MNIKQQFRLLFWFGIFGAGAWGGWKILAFIQPPAEFGPFEVVALLACCGLFVVLVIYGSIQSFK